MLYNKASVRVWAEKQFWRKCRPGQGEKPDRQNLQEKEENKKRS